MKQTLTPETMKYQHNECKVCGANEGRAGLLIESPDFGWVAACENCHDTREKGEIVIHANLQRTEEEIKKTFAILD